MPLNNPNFKPKKSYTMEFLESDYKILKIVCQHLSIPISSFVRSATLEKAKKIYREEIGE